MNDRRSMTNRQSIEPTSDRFSMTTDELILHQSSIFNR